MKKLILLPLALILLSCNKKSDGQTSDKNLSAIIEPDSAEKVKVEPVVIEGNWLMYAITKDGYYYIPKNALVDSVKAVVRPFYHPENIFRNKKMFKISWLPGCLDGSYNITVTPEQIFFSTSFDNPNSPKLYWVQEITQDQYKRIANSLKTNAPTDFEDYSEHSAELYSFRDKNSIGRLPDHPQPTDEQLEHACQNYDSLNMEQINRIYRVFNSMIAKETKNLTIPTKEELDKIKPKFFGYNKEDLQERVRHHDKYFR